MTTQRDRFLSGEGDRYFARNPATPAADDPLLHALLELDPFPRSVLEIGCADGWRLRAIHEATDAWCYGIDPSSKAVGTGNSQSVCLQVGTAENIPFDDKSFDLVIFGFCLYLCDRTHLFRIAMEADRVLKCGGYVASYDFWPPFPYKNSYSHADGIHSYKMDYSRMFEWNPQYSVIRKQRIKTSDSQDDWYGVFIIQKLSIDSAYPESPLSKSAL